LKSVDYIIVGQGLAGTLLAHDLIDKGQKVIVIDQDMKASASKVAAGLFNPVSMKRCIPTWNASIFLPFAIKRYQELEKKLATSFLNITPILKVFSNEEVSKQWKVQYSNTDINQYITTFNKEEKFSYLKDSSGTAQIDPAGNLEVNTFLSSSRDYFEGLDSYLNEEFDYKELNPETATYKEIVAKRVIFCEGFRVLENPFFSFLPIWPTKGEVIKIRIPSHKKLDYILSAGIYVLPLGNYEYIVGATYIHKELDEMVSDKGLSFLMDAISKILDVDFELIEAKAGVRPTVKDRKPLLGLHPLLIKLGVFNGLGTRGVLIGPSLSAQFCTNLTTKSNNIYFTENERLVSFFN
jgi:glycine/D-amino acid oxidase-like deaminating enzyme